MFIYSHTLSIHLYVYISNVLIKYTLKHSYISRKYSQYTQSFKHSNILITHSFTLSNFSYTLGYSDSYKMLNAHAPTCPYTEISHSYKRLVYSHTLSNLLIKTLIYSHKHSILF